MKNITIATLLLLTLALPAAAGTVADPVVSSDMVADAATKSTTSNIDGLMIALAYVLFLLAVGGAF